MSSDTPFTELFARVRRGEEQAAAELVRRFKSEVKRTIRFRLRDPQLRRHFDSNDIVQSVLLSFFVRASCGEYALDTPEQLLRLLNAMARNKLRDQARRHHAACRDNRLVTDIADHEVEDRAPGPGQQVEVRDQLDDVLRLLKPDEVRLAELRSQGHEWREIAEKEGSEEHKLRSKWQGIRNRVRAYLALRAESDNE